jgi:phosphoenolpyruvate phosphomutase
MRYKPYLRIMEAYSGLSGLIIENLKIEKEDGIHRFDGIFISVSIDTTHLGIFEPESSNSTSKLNVISDIIECTTKPIIVGGYTCDLQDNLSLVVEQLELKGISAIIIEDKCKKITLSGDIQELVNEEEFSYKIKEGKKGQTTSDFMIIAGIEELTFGKSVEEALKKASASIKAGADGILISSNEKNGDNVKAFCLKFKEENKDIPLILIPSSYNQYTEKELSEWGANIIIYANYLVSASYPAMKKCAEIILNSERSLEVNQMCMPIKEILNLIPGTN